MRPGGIVDMQRTPDAGHQLGLLDSHLPEGLVHVRDFISPQEEADLLASIASLALTQAHYKSYRAKRRTLSFGSGYDFDTNVLTPAARIPEFLLPLREKVGRWLSTPAEAFVQALITEYAPGTALGWHRDVPQFGIVVGISLHGPCRMRFRPYPPTRTRGKDIFTLDLQPRSAYVLRDTIRWGWQHSIPPTPGWRYSITFRTLRPGEGRSARQ